MAEDFELTLGPEAGVNLDEVLADRGLSPGALFAELHRIIAGLLPARNFYVATLGQGDGLIHFPYFVDEIIPEAPSRKPANGLTEHVLETGSAVRATHAELVAILNRKGGVTGTALDGKAEVLIDEDSITNALLESYEEDED